MTRLPTPGSDKGAWGDILNDFLSVSHNSDGRLKDDSVTTSRIAPEAVTTDNLASDVVTNTKLANMPAGTVKANLTGGTADPTDSTLATVKAALAITAADVGSLAAVATSGSYADLTDKPGTTFVALTQTEYDALSVKDPNTLYVVTD